MDSESDYGFVKHLDIIKYKALQVEHWKPLLMKCLKHNVTFTVYDSPSIPCLACYEECLTYS